MPKSNRKISNRKKFVSIKNTKLFEEIGEIYHDGNVLNQTDSDNIGPLWYGDPLIKNTHVRNPKQEFLQLKSTNNRFSRKDAMLIDREKRMTAVTEEQKQTYKTEVFKNSKAYYQIPRHHRRERRNIQDTRTSRNPGEKWYREALDWLNLRNGTPPEICKFISKDEDNNEFYDCVDLHDADGSGTITFKDLNQILCGMDDSYCVVDFCSPHCNSWYVDTSGNMRLQDCGVDGCGNQCGAWYGTTDDGCPPNGYNTWNYWVCQDSGMNSNGVDRKYCKGQQNAPPPPPPPPPPGSCFVEGTKISMADGSTKVIESVEVGDIVKTYNEETEQIENNKVLKLQNPIREGYYNLRYGDNDNLLGVTDEHPLYSSRMSEDGSISEMGWRSIVPESTLSAYPHLDFVGQLEINDYVLDDELNWHKINSVEYVEGDVQTYNLWSVENTNTFFAGGILAHNRCFIADTMVLTVDEGEKPIQSIRKGDKVYGYSGTELVENEVISLMVHEIGGDLVKVYTRKGHITGTKNHPLLAKTIEFDYTRPTFTNIEDLSIGDYLMDASGEPLEIISIEDLEDERVTYNLEITGNKTYIANGYRVHNARLTKNEILFGRQNPKHEYPNSARHPMRSPGKEPWVYYDLDSCEVDYIFGFRKTPCPGDRIPTELHPDKVREIIIGEVPGEFRHDLKLKQKWLLQKYYEKSRNEPWERVIEARKIAPPQVPT